MAIWDDSADKIYLYKGPISGSSTPAATVNTPTNDDAEAGGMAFDPSGNLWVAYGDTALYEAVSKNLGIAILPRSFVRVRRPERFATIELTERIELHIAALYSQPLDPALLDLIKNLKCR